jgi:hypothetical protein
MRGAWGKPNGTVARVNIGQIIMSVRTRDSSTLRPSPLARIILIFFIYDISWHDGE